MDTPIAARDARIEADLQRRLATHILRAPRWNGVRLGPLGERNQLVLTHPASDIPCCSLRQKNWQWDGPPDGAQEVWQITQHCEQRDCPIGFLLTWTTAGRKASPVGTLATRPRRIECLRCWPAEMFTGGDRTVLALLCEFHFDLLVEFAEAAFAWWALAAVDNAPPLDVRHIIGHYLARATIDRPS